MILCRSRSGVTLPAIVLALSFVAGACEKVPLLAPSGSTITLTASTNALPVDGTTDIIAQVLEAAGTPPHSGTVISFVTTLGSIEPADARTDVSGRVIVKFRSGNANGTATITALSGGATTGTAGALKIAVGTAAVGRITVSANPATLPSTGGSTTISASVFDINGNALRSTPVSFTTEGGSLSSAVATTDANGNAFTVLTTSQPAKVTATVGATAPSTGTPGTGTTTPAPTGQVSGVVTVPLLLAPGLMITPPTQAPSVGVPAIFTFNVTVPTGGVPIRELRVTWGDGGSDTLGAVTGSSVQTHVYRRDGPHTVTGTVTDIAGSSTSVSTSVTVIPVPRPTININFTPANPLTNSTINFTIQVTTTPGIGVVSTTIDFADGDVRQLGGATSATVQKVYTTPGVRTVRVTVVDTTGQVTEGTTLVSVN